MNKLSKNLIPILDFELAVGNSVLRIDEPAGTLCPYAIILSKPLHFEKLIEKGLINKKVSKWINNDPHYPLEAGVLCEVTRHVISGPIS